MITGVIGLRVGGIWGNVRKWKTSPRVGDQGDLERIPRDSWIKVAGRQTGY